MTNERHIGNIQLVSLLLFSRIFALFCGGITGAPAALMAYAPAFFALQLILAWLLCRFVTPHISALLRIKALRLLLWLLCAWIAADSALTFISFMTAEFSGVYSAWAAFALTAAAGISLWRGTEALGRGSVVLAGIAAAALAVIGLSLIGSYDVLNFSTAELSVRDALSCCRSLLGWQELAALTVLAASSKGFRFRSAAAWSAAALILTELLFLAAALVLGGYARLSAYPLIDALGAFSAGARAFCLLLPATACFVRVTLFLQLCCFAWRGGLFLLPKGKTAALNTAAVGALAAALMLSGCSVGVDISSRAVATSAFVERRGDALSVTLECICDPQGDSPEYTVLSADGASFSDCITSIRRNEGIEPYLSGCRWLVISGAESRGDIAELLRMLDEDGRLPRAVRVAVGQGFLPQGGEEAAASALDLSLSDFDDTLLSVLERCTAEGRGLLLPLAGEEGALAGYLSPSSDGGEYFAVGLGGAFADCASQERPIITLTGNITADVALERCRIRAIPKAGKTPAFEIIITARGYIAACSGEPSAQTLDAIQARLAERLSDDIRALLDDVTINGGNDIFSLGRIMSLRLHKQWQEYSGNWENHLAQLEYTVRTDIVLTDKKQLLSR